MPDDTQNPPEAATDTASVLALIAANIEAARKGDFGKGYEMGQADGESGANARVLEAVSKALEAPDYDAWANELKGGDS